MDRLGTILWDLLVPVALIAWGIWLVNKSPNVINNSYGYRTKRAALSRDTWDFAQRYAGKVWIILGAVMLPVSLAVALISAYYEMSEAVDLVLAAGQIALVFLAIIPIESALKKNFDNRGKRRK